MYTARLSHFAVVAHDDAAEQDKVERHTVPTPGSAGEPGQDQLV
jgi:hypothetical protein